MKKFVPNKKILSFVLYFDNNYTMKHKLSIAGLLLCVLTMTAQTNVERVVPTKATGDGIVYSLPKSSIIVNVEVTKVTLKAGPYYRYAELYLGLKNVITEDAVYYELGKITMVNKGVPDPNKTYKIEFRQKTVAPFAYLTREGLLCAINTEYVPDFEDEERRVEYKDITAFSTSAYTEEILIAGSVVRQAEVAARRIYRLRESRTDIITGEADNPPPDGEAMKLQISILEEQERDLVYLFTGTVSKETTYYDVVVVPEDELEREVLFRFSTKLGILDSDDLGGEPVYLNLTAVERAQPLDPKEAEKKAKTMKGIVYNVPGRGHVEIIHNNKSLFKKDTQVVQFGFQDILAPVLLEDKKLPVKVTFYPETGAIRQLSQ